MLHFFPNSRRPTTHRRLVLLRSVAAAREGLQVEGFPHDHRHVLAHPRESGASRLNCAHARVEERKHHRLTARTKAAQSSEVRLLDLSVVGQQRTEIAPPLCLSGRAARLMTRAMACRSRRTHANKRSTTHFPSFKSRALNPKKLQRCRPSQRWDHWRCGGRLHLRPPLLHRGLRLSALIPYNAGPGKLPSTSRRP